MSVLDEASDRILIRSEQTDPTARYSPEDI